jgi:hypothetical protein
MRKRLGVKLHQRFQFTNQKSKVNMYYFDSTGIVKEDIENGSVHLSHVSFNFLLSDECAIEKFE